MSTVIVRKVAGSPIRTSSEAWDVICKLVAPDPASPARKVLSKATGVACSSIASEVLNDKPIVVLGPGPRIRFYALYGDDAVSGEDISEAALPEAPSTGDWRMSIPCPDEDFDWCKKEIKSCAPYISVRRLDDEVPDRDGKASAAQLKINIEEFLKP
jgi:hypothetical protein